MSAQNLEKFIKFTSIDLRKINIVEAMSIATELVGLTYQYADIEYPESIHKTITQMVDNDYAELKDIQRNIISRLAYLRDTACGVAEVVSTTLFVFKVVDGIFETRIIPASIQDAIYVALGMSCAGIKQKDIKKCPSCGTFFVQKTKKNRSFCSNACSSRQASKENYAKKKETKSTLKIMLDKS